MVMVGRFCRPPDTGTNSDRTSLVVVCIVCCLVLCGGEGVWGARYPDQAGKSDWIRHNIGRIEQVWHGRKTLIATTNENALVGLNIKDGNLVWRHILEEETLLDADHNAYQLLSISYDEQARMCHARLWNSMDGTLLWDQTITVPQYNTEDTQPTNASSIYGSVRIASVNKLYALHCGGVVAMVDDKGADKWVHDFGEESSNKQLTVKNIEVSRPDKGSNRKLNIDILSYTPASSSGICYDVHSLDATSSKEAHKPYHSALCCDTNSKVAYLRNQFVCLEEKNLNSFDSEQRAPASTQLSDLEIPSTVAFAQYQELNSFDGVLTLEDKDSHSQYLVHPSSTFSEAHVADDGEQVTQSHPGKGSKWTVATATRGTILKENGKAVLVEAAVNTSGCTTNDVCPISLELRTESGNDQSTVRISTQNGVQADEDHLIQVSFVHAEHFSRRNGDIILALVQLSDWSHHLVRVKTKHSFNEAIKEGSGQNPVVSVVAWSREDCLSQVDDFVAVEAAPSEARMSIVPQGFLESFEASEDQGGSGDITLDEVKEEALLQFIPRLRLQAFYVKERVRLALRRLLNLFQSVDSIAEAVAIGRREALDAEAPVNRTLSDPVYGYDTSVITVKRVSATELFVIAIRGETGALMWKRRVYVSGSVHGQSVRLFAARVHQVSVVTPEVVLMESHIDRASGEPVSQILWIDAWSGHVDRTEKHAFAIQQVVGLPSSVHGPHHSKAWLVFHEHGNDETVATVHPFRKETINQFDRISDTFVVQSLSREDQSLVGVRLQRRQSEEGSYSPSVLWSYKCSHSPSDDIAVYAPVDGKLADSFNAYGTGEDSVLLKYSSVNLLAVVSAEKLPAGANSSTNAVTVAILDAVNGRVIHTRKHYNAVGPVYGIFVENWFYYSWRQVSPPLTTMAVLSLYEATLGSKELLPWNMSPWASDFVNRPQEKGVVMESAHNRSVYPLVFYKEYILPRSVSTMDVTRTKRGIPNRNILVGTRRGEIWTLDQRWLDPRRPTKEPTSGQITEKLLQYAPHIPLQHTELQTYQHSVAALSRIYSLPANLESTSLVFGIGLDIFHCRVSPANSFDVLNEDFNVPLFLLLTVVMVFVTIFVKNMVNNKKLKQSWA
eukprot:gb/GECG01007512.1/.p1 GENE.gb/GECG01007512.1/~~gb/GECG01007512.1/.p1  ORF type:complete len:1121 (+),score=135.10 gb/GECG01007512.1/:1-3363(+)